MSGDAITQFEPGSAAALARFDPDGSLSSALGRVPTQDELAVWAGMPTDRRETTLARGKVLRRWIDEPGEMTAAEAADAAGVKVSRWYEIVAAWRISPTLQSIGTFAKRPGRRGQRLDGDAVNALQSVLPGLVRENSRSSVSATVALLRDAPELGGMSLPHENTLRRMVERERRRLKAEQQVGVRPGFDASACELRAPDGGYHVLFAVVDRTSRLILGAAVGDLSRSREAYAEAARDALARLQAPDASSLPWADGTDRVDVVVGSDQAAWREVEAEYRTTRLAPDFGLVFQDRRYGRYLRLAAGGAIGGVRLFPTRTGGADAAPTGHVYTEGEARAALEVAIGRHNAEVLAESVADGAPRPAAITLAVLDFVADA